jgi:hypothetical protein
MESYRPIIAIVGSARSEILPDQEKEKAARKACNELGQKLAAAGWRIAVYSSNNAFIEPDVVTGYVAAGAAGKNSIVCYYPQEASVNFPEMEEHKDKEYFDQIVDPSSDWEVSFYRSLAKVDGIVLLGGGASTLIAGNIALSRDLAIIAVARFGGASLRFWQQQLPSKPAFIEEYDINIMGRWTAKSATELVKSLSDQYKRRQSRLSAAETELQGLKDKAQKWDELSTEKKEDKARTYLALGFLIVFIVFLIVGLITDPPARLYSLLTIVGLCFAGGMGATIRMLTPGAPTSRKWVATVLGITVGLVFSLLYLIPQLIQNSGFLIPVPGNTGITTATRVQYISSLIVAFLAGLGFDFAVDQLLRRAQQSGDEIIDSSTAGAASRKL